MFLTLICVCVRVLIYISTLNSTPITQIDTLFNDTSYFTDQSQRNL